MYFFGYDLEDYLEVSAFTSPAHRCQGAFTSLFQKLMEGYEETPVCFYPDGNSYDALMTMEVLDCEYSGTEHLMRLEKDLKWLWMLQLQKIIPPLLFIRQQRMTYLHLSQFTVPPSILEKEDSIAFLEQSFDTGETIWCITANNTIVGLVLTSIQPDQTNLYGLAIHPEYQKKGYGRDAVKVLLQKPEITFPVTLHVTEENEAAFKIYKGMGFVTTQELMEVLVLTNVSHKNSHHKNAAGHMTGGILFSPFSRSVNFLPCLRNCLHTCTFFCFPHVAIGTVQNAPEIDFHFQLPVLLHNAVHSCVCSYGNDISLPTL